MLLANTISSETNLESEAEHALLIFSKIKSFFILRCLTVLLMAYLTAIGIVKGPQKYRKVPFVTIVIHWRVISCFYTCSFSSSYDAPIASFLKIGNIRVAPPFLELLSHIQGVAGKLGIFQTSFRSAIILVNENTGS